MNEVWPDNWVVIRLQIPEVNPNDPHVYKVLGGWSGGYLNGDSWRINSGIVRVEEDGDYYLFYGNSGSVYRCSKNTNFLKMNNAHVYDRLVREYGPEAVQLVPEDTNYLELVS